MSCLLCGREIVRSGAPGRPRKYCDDECRGRAAKVRQRERYALIYDRLAEQRAGGLHREWGSEQYLRGRAAELRAYTGETA